MLQAGDRMGGFGRTRFVLGGFGRHGGSRLCNHVLRQRQTTSSPSVEAGANQGGYATHYKAARCSVEASVDVLSPDQDLGMQEPIGLKTWSAVKGGSAGDGREG
jgi:hypothetical protein